MRLRAWNVRVLTIERTSKSEWIGIGHFLERFCRKGCDGSGFVKPDVFIELVRQDGLEIVTRELRFRPVDHADCTLQPRLAQAL